MAEVYPFDRILLEPEQKDLLITLVEADRSVPRNKRKKIQVWTTEGDDEVYTSLRHPGLTNSPSVFQGDIDALARVGLLDPSYESSSLTEYTITPRGYAYYRYLIEQTAEPTQRVEERVRHYFDADRFRRAYPSVLQKWADAETLLWSAESELQLTTIGHLCREAMQTFATVLVERYRPDGVDQNQASTRARMMAVLQAKSEELGSTEVSFLKALHAYWCELDALVQRQEHGAQREKQALTWEDARRVVFQCAVVMFEIDRSLGGS